MNFKDWAPLKFVDSELLSQVRLAYVFGRNGQEAFIITENDEVFACGSNSSGCLGLATEGFQIKPIRVPQLCQKNVRGFSCSLRTDEAFVCAYTSDETIFFWGKYPEGLLYQTPAYLKAKSFTKVVEMVGGPNHCLILSSDGQIHSFGYNKYGQLGRQGCNNIPDLVEGDLKGKMVTKVSCGTHFSVAVLDNGEVYAWGTNCHGQLGKESGSLDSKIPSKVSALTNVIVKDIVCGESYVLAISNVGELYSWGQNNVGQLGLGDTTSRFRPEKVETIGKVIDVAATAYGSTSAVMNENDEVYMWGTCGVLKVNQNYEGLHAYLQYLYSGNFKGTPEVALESLKIAHEYHDLAWKKICEDHVKRGVKVENVAYLYSLVVKLDTKDLAKHCVSFAGKHIGEIIDTPGFSEWDADTDKQFIRDCYEQKLFRN